MAAKCGAERRGGGECGRPAGWGTSHPGIGRCKNHGGSTPNHQRAAEREIAARAVARFALVDEDAVEDADPRDLLAREMWRSHLAVEFLGRLVNELGLDVYEHTFHQTGEPTGEAKPHVLWAMWMEERKHLKAVAAEAARAGIEVRRQQLAEQQAHLIAAVLRAVFDDPALDLTAEQRKVGLQVAARELRALPAG